MAKVDVETQGDVAVLRLSNPPVNALAHGVRVGLAEAIRAAISSPAVKAIVVTGAGRAFSAGADIAEFASGLKEPGLPEVIDEMEASPKPVVAAVNGLALGGGLEVVLGCHYRVIASSVGQLGLPEVKIGILPGAGGTQRLPRVIGVEAALDAIVTGSFMNAATAARNGLADKVVEGDVVAGAVAFARELVASGRGPRPASASRLDPASIPAGLFDKKRAGLGKHPSGPMAARHCIAAVEAAVGSDYRTGVAREKALFAELAASPYAKALQYAFFAERKAAEIPDIGREVQPRPVETVGIVGAGTMGVGIGLALLQSGLPVTIVETTQPALDRGLARIRDTIEGNVKRGRLSQANAEKILGGLKGTLDLGDLGRADFIIEAGFEKLAVKQEVFRKLDAIAKPGAVLASNTSTLDVDKIAAVTKRPQDVLGTHFFSPANIMRLLEVVRGAKTAKETLATAMAVAKRINKVGVVAGVCFGFIGNRMVEAYLEEVQAMMLEGASPAEIDGALEGWGLAMGPNAMMDLAGIDVGYLIRREHTFSEERLRLYRVTDRIAEMGRHGQKTGAGYYKYEGRTRTPDPEIVAMFAEEARAQRINQRTLPPEEIVERCLLRLANEGAQLLDEGIALRASDIDTIYLTGYGFPAWRGGPMWQIETAIGLAETAAKVKAYEAKHGPRWKLAPLIERLAREGGTLAKAGPAAG
ncbi:MAG: 3-hydroxyacyl-CoA dehydrogenase NAD-binding domain-containing protein [Hyphomicrobiaceae bacterium]|nr:3-hydroxyacyl-CoA dehydrogenase NAD-binding domain-containing protein [Hyphomicrobiaceae bacterium]